MPTYVYKFVETGETIEVQQAFTDDSLTEAVHPASGTVRPVKKVFTSVGVTFNGGGFYKTDARGSGSSSSSSSGSSSPGGSPSSTPASSTSGSSATGTPSSTATPGSSSSTGSSSSSGSSGGSSSD